MGVARHRFGLSQPCCPLIGGAGRHDAKQGTADLIDAAKVQDAAAPDSIERIAEVVLLALRNGVAGVEHQCGAKFQQADRRVALVGPLGKGKGGLFRKCRQNKAWQDAGAEPITVCVNVSPRQFTDPSWVDRVQAALTDSGLEARYLELELTEGLLMQDVEYAIATMKRLQALGVGLAIDDFGTGYSSLSALKSFPVGRLKIDRSFIRGEESDRSIARAVISLGRQLNLKVIAEGVETEEQVDFLTNSQCDEVQGFHFSKPVDADSIAELLVRQHRTN